mgnify:CR=1 FL=1
MKLVNSQYSLSVDFAENSINTLVVERPQYMSDIVQDFISKINGENGNFVLSEETEIKFEKDVIFITEPFTLDLNEKRVIHKLYTQLADVAIELTEDYNSINQSVVNAFEKITDGIAYNNIDYNLEFDWKELYKLYHFRISESFDSLYEKLEEYIKILAQIIRPKLVIFLNLKAFLDKEEMDNLIKICFYNKVTILLIESDERYSLDNEKMFIIDKDRCLVVK